MCFSLTLKSTLRSLTFLEKSTSNKSTSLFNSLKKLEVLVSKFSCISQIFSAKWFSTPETLWEKDSNLVKYSSNFLSLSISRFLKSFL